MKCIHRAFVERYWQIKTEVLRQKRVPLRVCPPQIPHWWECNPVLSPAREANE